jgi:hypothetical protein
VSVTDGWMSPAGDEFEVVAQALATKAPAPAPA